MAKRIFSIFAAKALTVSSGFVVAAFNGDKIIAWITQTGGKPFMSAGQIDFLILFGVLTLIGATAYKIVDRSVDHCKK